MQYEIIVIYNALYPSTLRLQKRFERYHNCKKPPLLFLSNFTEIKCCNHVPSSDYHYFGQDVFFKKIRLYYYKH